MTCGELPLRRRRADTEIAGCGQARHIGNSARRVEPDIVAVCDERDRAAFKISASSPALSRIRSADTDPGIRTGIVREHVVGIPRRRRVLVASAKAIAGGRSANYGDREVWIGRTNTDVSSVRDNTVRRGRAADDERRSGTDAVRADR